MYVPFLLSFHDPSHHVFSDCVGTLSVRNRRLRHLLSGRLVKYLHVHDGCPRPHAFLRYQPIAASVQTRMGSRLFTENSFALHSESIGRPRGREVVYSGAIGASAADAV